MVFLAFRVAQVKQSKVTILLLAWISSGGGGTRRHCPAWTFLLCMCVCVCVYVSAFVCKNKVFVLV